jgi:hypothetical protein
VHKLGIGADRHDFSGHFLEPVRLLCQSSKFGRSHKGEISRVEKENCPLLIRFRFVKIKLAEIFADRIISLNLK